VAKVQGNYRRRCVHRFEPVAADGIRLAVQATNGDASAKVSKFEPTLEAGRTREHTWQHPLLESLPPRGSNGNAAVGSDHHNYRFKRELHLGEDHDENGEPG